MIFARKSPLSRLLPRFSAPSGAALILCGLAGGNGAWSQDFSDKAGTAEFQYLETLIFARPAGLAGAYTSLAQGIDAVGYNPAGLSKSQAVRAVSGTFRYHFLDVTSGNATYAYPGTGNMAYAFSAAYINYGHIEELDENGDATGRKNLPVSFNPSFTAARKVSDAVRLGATLKGLSEYLGDYAGSQLALGWGVDLGLLYQPNVRNMGFGLALLNFGRKETAHTLDGRTGGLLPVSLKGGMFYYPLDLPKAKVAVDAEVPWHDAPRLSGGVEYAYSPSFTMRLGSRIDWTEARYYFLKATDERPGDLQGGNALKLSGGFTFVTESIGLDYAVQYWNGLSWVHAMTVRYALL
ncbi:MAG: hypothetical protein JWP91_3432 [Fibrobacteres bacterium]|nr:hypothetical protein [Fibrobacterota bacterium]